MVKSSTFLYIVAVVAVLALAGDMVAADERWIQFEGTAGPGQGKHIVFVTGDEEYRSEESMPMLAKILAVHHGFKCLGHQEVIALNCPTERYNHDDPDELRLPPDTDRIPYDWSVDLR